MPCGRWIALASDPVVLRLSVNMRRPYGAAVARTFLAEILTAARDVPVQIAHLTGVKPAMKLVAVCFADHKERLLPGWRYHTPP
jgi:hypothetical protein